MVNKLLAGLRTLFANRRQFILECIRVGLALWFLVLVYIPFFSITDGETIVSFTLMDFNLWFLWLYFFGMVLGYIFFRLLNVNKPAKYLLIVMATYSLLFLFASMIFFLIGSTFAESEGLSSLLNVGFFFQVIYIILMFLIALKEEMFLSPIDKILRKKQK